MYKFPLYKLTEKNEESKENGNFALKLIHRKNIDVRMLTNDRKRQANVSQKNRQMQKTQANAKNTSKYKINRKMLVKRVKALWARYSFCMVDVRK